MIYDPTKSIEELAALNKVSVSAVRWYIKQNNIDRRNDNKIAILRQIKEAIERQRDISLRALAKELQLSVNTVRKYLNDNESVSNKDNSKLSIFDTSKQESIIKSVNDNQDELIYNILQLYIKRDTFDIDLTASTLGFYKKISKPQLLFDKYPQLEEVKPLSEAYNLPLNTYHSIMLDLPFLIKRESDAGNLKIVKRFGYFNSLEELYQTNEEMIRYAFSRLKKGGFLVVKTMDFTFGENQIWTSLYIQNKAIEVGFTLEDTFILTGQKRLLAYPKGQQRHARKYHCYFFVFKKKR